MEKDNQISVSEYGLNLTNQLNQFINAFVKTDKNLGTALQKIEELEAKLKEMEPKT